MFDEVSNEYGWKNYILCAGGVRGLGIFLYTPGDHMEELRNTQTLVADLKRKNTCNISVG